MMRETAGSRVSTLLANVRGGEGMFLVVTSLAIGVLAGLGNILFRTVMNLVHDVVFVGGSSVLGIGGGGLSRLLVPLLPVCGALLLIPLALRHPGEAGGYGFPAFLEAVNIKGGFLRARNILFKTLGPALTIGSGGSAGVEGPIAIIGGTIGSSVGRMLRVSGSRIRLMIAAGAAGGIAATFNAPIAGVMFATEIVLLGDYGIASFSAIVISSGIATVLSRWYFGATPAFVVPQYELKSVLELPFYLLLGLVAGLVAVAYIRTFYRIRDGFDASKLHPFLRPVFGAFLVGCIGILLPQVMGNGYGFIEDALHERISFSVILALVVFKILATSLTLGSGGAGGVFAPALFIGAMTGGAVGHLAHFLFPGVTATPGAYATVGIGAVLAATTHAPLTGIFLLFEMTGNYRIIVPLMFAAIIGTFVSRSLYRDSIDTAELTRRGVRVRAGREAGLMGKVLVREVMTPGVLTVGRSTTLRELIEIMVDRERFYLPVVDERGEMTGIVSIQDVRPALLNESLSRIVIAGDIATEQVIVLTPDDDLNTAMERFGRKDIEEIPVVDGRDSRRLLGMLKRRDVIAAYNREILKRESARSG